MCISVPVKILKYLIKQLQLGLPFPHIYSGLPSGFCKDHTSEVNGDMVTNASANLQSFSVELVSAISARMTCYF